MRAEWNELYGRVADLVADAGVLFFRGQEQEDWGLVPAIGRERSWTDEERAAREFQLFYDFKIHAGNLLEDEDDAWRIAFLMQHHGLPTRLLDWSASFAIALHFALRHAAEHDAVVWILDALHLNRELLGREQLIMHSDLDGDYQDYFIARRKKLPGRVMALAPSRSSPRLQQQRGFFTLHGELGTGLEEILPSALTKIVIPRALCGEARTFLRLSGVNEFSLFPDLDGLARHLNYTHKLREHAKTRPPV